MKQTSLPAVGNVAQLLLLCSREALNAQQAAYIVELTDRIDDWEHLLQQADFRMIVPLVYQHLARLRPPGLPEGVLARLRAQTRLILMKNLRMVALQRRIYRDVLMSLEVPHIFFKGPTLAYRYYTKPEFRMCRDLDLLMPREFLVPVGRRLRELGFISYPDAEMASDDALAFKTRFLGITDWISPEGVLIEISCSMDPAWGRLPTNELTSESECVDIGDTSYPIMESTDFFVYMCRHHTRHHWARLHWIADLDALVKQPDFDKRDVRERAKRRGFESTVDAVFEINQAAAQPEPWKYEFKGKFARKVFKHCLLNLEGDRKTEMELRAAFPTLNLDIHPARRALHYLLGHNLQRFRPTQEDYLHWPLPEQWHNAYYFLRPFLWPTRKIRNWLSGSQVEASH